MPDILDEKLKRDHDDAIYGTPMDAMPRKSKRGETRSRWPLFVGAGCVSLCCLFCILPWCVLTVLGVSAAKFISDKTATVTQTQTIELDADNEITLSVYNPVGSITVQPGLDDNLIRIEYTKKAFGWSTSQAEKELDNINVDIPPADDNNKVSITVDTDRREDNFFSFANQVSMTITVPSTLHLVLESNTGAINVEGVKARSLDLKSNTGSITFDGALGLNPRETFKIKVNTGSIDVVLARDTKIRIDADTNTGNISVAEDFGRISDEQETRTGAGEHWSGTLGTSSEVLPEITLYANTGSITINAH